MLAPSMIVDVAEMLYWLPDCQLSFLRHSLKLSNPATRLCEPRLWVERKYDALTNQSQLSRCSSHPPPQTAQNVGELNRGLSVPMVFDRSEIGVPLMRSVKREPVSIVAEIFREYCPSRKKFGVSTLV